MDGPKVEAEADRQLTIMKYQVSEGEYARCVEAGKCQAVEAPHVHGTDFQVTGVSYDDAQAYARWLSGETSEVWTLPSHEQIVFAAGTKFVDDALGVDPDSRNPALRWLADYEWENRRKADSNPARKERVHFGENEFGMGDFVKMYDMSAPGRPRGHLDRGDLDLRHQCDGRPAPLAHEFVRPRPQDRRLLGRCASR